MRHSAGEVCTGSDPLLGFLLVVGGGLGLLAGGARLAHLHLALARILVIALLPVLLEDGPAPPLYQLLRMAGSQL